MPGGTGVGVYETLRRALTQRDTSSVRTTDPTKLFPNAFVRFFTYVLLCTRALSHCALAHCHTRHCHHCH